MFPWLLVLFIGVPLIELGLFMSLGKTIGILETLLIVFLTGALGAWLAKTQGLQTLARFQRANQEGRLPQEEVLDGVMILIASAVLLTPGFLTDVFGFFLLIPRGRQLVRKLLGTYLQKRVHIHATHASAGASSPPPPRGSRPIEGKVIDAEIVDD